MIKCLKYACRAFAAAAPNPALKDLNVEGVTIVRDKASANRALEVLYKIPKRYYDSAELSHGILKPMGLTSKKQPQ